MGQKILGKYSKEKIIIKLDKQRLAIVNTIRNNIKPIQFANDRITSIVMTKDYIFYVLWNDRSQIHKKVCWLNT